MRVSQKSLFLMFMTMVVLILSSCGGPNKQNTSNTLSIQYPVMAGIPSPQRDYILEKGWYEAESTHTWSQGSASLRIPISASCEESKCETVIRFKPFLSANGLPSTVTFSSGEGKSAWQQEFESAKTAEWNEVRIPAESAQEELRVTISVPNTASPLELGLSQDSRKLGIAISTIDLVKVQS